MSAVTQERVSQSFHCPEWCEVTLEQHQSETQRLLDRVRRDLQIHGLSPDPSDVLICHEVTVDSEPGRWTVGFDAYENSDGTVDPAGPNIYIEDDSTLTCSEMDRIAAATATVSARLKALGAA